MEKLKLKTIKSNWITYLVLFFVVVTFSTFLTPLEYASSRWDLFSLAVFTFFTYQMIVNLIGLAVIILLDYFLFNKDELKRFFITETIILLVITTSIFIFIQEIYPAIAVTISICCSQYLRYKFIHNKVTK